LKMSVSLFAGALPSDQLEAVLKDVVVPSQCFVAKC
jgi:hypothetical protein